MEPLFKLYGSRWLLVFSLISMVVCSIGFNELQMRLGASIIDALLGGYDFQTVQERFLIYGEDGRALYARAALTLDIFYPVVYSTFFAGLIIMGAVSPGARYLVLVPLLTAFLDIGENVSIYLLLTNFPAITEAEVLRSSSLTIAKWWAVAFTLVIAFGQLALRLAMLTVARLRR